MILLAVGVWIPSVFGPSPNPIAVGLFSSAFVTLFLSALGLRLLPISRIRFLWWGDGLSFRTEVEGAIDEAGWSRVKNVFPFWYVAVTAWIGSFLLRAAL